MTKATRKDERSHDDEGAPVLLTLTPQLREFLSFVAVAAGVPLETVINVALAWHFAPISKQWEKPL
jgi:hypothetical protein